jgi:hypothetical protein
MRGITSKNMGFLCYRVSLMRGATGTFADSKPDRYPSAAQARCNAALVYMTFNHGIEGSSPSALTNIIKYLDGFLPTSLPRKRRAGSVGNEIFSA